MIKASAPGRAGIIGNPTDIYGGTVISCSVGERAYCRLVPSKDLLVSTNGNSITIADRSGLALDGSEFDIVKASFQALEIDPAAAKISIDVRSDVPEQAGLAGSSAMLASIMGCLLAYLEIELDKHELAEMIRATEADIMKVSCGYQDHYMTVFGGLNYMDFRGKEWMKSASDEEKEPFATVEPLTEAVGDLPMILAHTGVKRHSGGVHKGLRERWLEGDKQVVDGYRRIAELGRLGKRALLAQNWKELGSLMNENHAIQRDLGGSAECNEKLIETALSHGAYGAKLAGAGHGGTIIALTDDIKGMSEALLNAGAGRILRLQPVEGLIVEREWQSGYNKQSTGANRLRRRLDGRRHLRQRRRRSSAECRN